MSSHPPWSDQLRLSLLRVDRSAAVGIAVLAAVVVVVTVALVLHARPHPVVFTGDASAAAAGSGAGISGAAGMPAAPGGSSASAAAPSSVTPSTSGEVVVDVAGRVRRPGLVRLPVGSRVGDAVAAAGGLTRASDAPSVNLAQVLVDGEQVLVGPGAGVAAGGVTGAGAGGAAGAAGGGDAAAPVDLNTATLEQLESLPGVGPVLAQRILDYRTAQGPFRSVDGLRDVTGIGDKKFADIAPHARV